MSEYLWREPGSQSVKTSDERSGFLSLSTRDLITSGSLSPLARDATNPISDKILREGLVLAKTGTAGEFTHYDPDGAHPQNVAVGILGQEAMATDGNDGDNRNYLPIVVGGFVIASLLNGLDRLAREHLRIRFVFDDEIERGLWYDYACSQAKTADYSITKEESGGWFTNRGATGPVTFTLPAIERGLRYRFAIEEDQDFTLTGPINSLVVFNNNAATAVQFITAGQRIGVTMEAIANDEQNKWMILMALGGNTAAFGTPSTGCHWLVGHSFNQPFVWDCGHF